MVKKVNLNEGKFSLPDFFESVTKRIQRDITRSWQIAVPPVLIQNIKETIERGVSPVRGGGKQGSGRFQEYSDSYKKAIMKGRYKQHGKKLRPVNLTLSGDMMRSLVSRSFSTGFVIEFTDPLAYIHSVKGAGKSKTIRKIMPTGKEVFKKSVTLESNEFLEKNFKDELSKIF